MKKGKNRVPLINIARTLFIFIVLVVFMYFSGVAVGEAISYIK